MAKNQKEETACLRFLIKQAQKCPRLSRTEENEILEKICEQRNEGEETKRLTEIEKKIVESNMAFAIFFARKNWNSGLAIEDLIQTANIGLILAVKTFKSDCGCGFARWAGFYIKTRIDVELAYQSDNISVSRQLRRTIIEIEKTEKNFLQNYKRLPTHEELAECLGLTKEKISEVQIIRKRGKTFSFYNPVKEDDDSTIDCVIPDSKNISSEETVQDKDMADQIHKVLTTLKASEEKVIRLRFGLR